MVTDRPISDDAAAIATQAGNDDNDPAEPRFIWSRNLRFPVPTPQLNAKRKALLRDGRYEQKEYMAVKSLVHTNDVVVELGAGIGFISATLSARMNVKEVHAFEANPELIPYIKKVYAANGVKTVTLYHAIVDKEDGPPVDFHIRRDFVASSRVKPDKQNVRTIKVERIGAASLFSVLKPTVLICDIEGGEAALLPYIDVSPLRAVIVELHPKQIGSGSIAAIFDAMHRQGLFYSPEASSGKVVAFVRGLSQSRSD